MEYSQVKKVHIIGIEGGGTSALACLYKSLGLEVTGSDEGDHFFKANLINHGIESFDKFDTDNIPEDADLIVYSSAFKPETNIELKSALNSGKTVLTYAQALADIFNQQQGIAIAGSHGKTTVTAWLAYIMQQANLNPNMIVGSKVPQLNSSMLVGKSDYFIIEADEYQNKLADYQPKMVILNNIDYDHPDFFKTKEEYLNAFVQFAKKIPVTGWLIANYDDENIVKHIRINCLTKIISYGLDNQKVNYLASEIKHNHSEQIFHLQHDNHDLGEFKIRLMGRHNILNALAVIAACLELGIDLEIIKKYLFEFTGTDRRLQVMGSFRGVPILDDFAHHPTEIKAVLEAVRQSYPDQRLVAVFHPHTFTRTKALFNDFVNSFDLVDELIILNIYGSAREEQGGVSSQELVEKINLVQSDKQAKNIPTIPQAEEYLRHNLKTGDVLLLMGAGDVFKIGQGLLG